MSLSKPFRALGAAASALALAACVNLAPAYQRPAAPVPAALPSGGVYGPPDARISAADAPWRSVLLDSRLQAVVARAVTDNRNLRQALAQVDQARALYRVQRSAQFPVVDASAGATTTRSRSLFGGGASTSESYSVDAGISAFELDLFGRLRNLSESALQEYLATEQGARAARIALIAETASAWLTLSADAELLRIARDTAEVAGRSSELNRRRLEGGISDGLTQAQADTIAQTARADAAALATQVAQDRNALELLVGGPVADSEVPTALAPGAVLADVPAGVSSEVLLNRPDVLQAEALLRARGADIGAARAAFFPRISLTGLLGFASPELGQLFNGDSFTYQAGGSGLFTLFDAGARRGNLEAARAAERAAVAAYELAIQTAFQEAADALARRGTLAEEAAATEGLRRAAATSLRLSEQRFRVGADSFLAQLDAQRTAYAAEQRGAALELTRQLNTVQLYRALGGGLR